MLRAALHGKRMHGMRMHAWHAHKCVRCSTPTHDQSGALSRGTAARKNLNAPTRTLLPPRPPPQPFHGKKELFLSDHFDTCSVATVIGRCRVLTVREYQALTKVGEHDYFSRFTYRPAPREFVPDRVPV
jgi:hypothetical protein